MSFKELFSKQASDYARFRPTYSENLFRYLASLTLTGFLVVCFGLIQNTAFSDEPTPGNSSFENARQAEGQYVIVQTNLSEAVAGEVLGVAESVFPICKETLRIEPRFPVRKVVIKLFRDEEEQFKYFPEDREDTSEAHEHYDRFTNTVRLTYYKGYLFQPVAHEVTHGFLHQIFAYPIPAWLNEGIAECMASTGMKRDGEVLTPEAPRQRWLKILRQSYREGKLLPWTELISIEHPRRAQSKDLFYAQSWSLVRYLLKDISGDDKQHFHQFLQELQLQEKGGIVPATDLFRRIFRDPGQLEKRWLRQLEEELDSGF